MTAELRKAIQVFYSYAPQDESLREELEKHLSFLQRRHFIAGWHYQKITAGKDVSDEVSIHLNTSQMILLLVSPDFLASDYCFDVEVRQALERHASKEAYVIPIILRPVAWEDTPFGKLQALPAQGKPVTTWLNRDEAFLDIAKGIQKVVTENFSVTGFAHKVTFAHEVGSLPTKSTESGCKWKRKRVGARFSFYLQ